MEHIVWDIDPEIFRLGSFGPRYYGLMFALGFLGALRIADKIWQNEGQDKETLSSLLVHVMIGTIIGARLGHCLFYDPGYYLTNPLEIIKIWKGGLASHGGTLGVILAIYLYSRKNPQQPYVWLADRLATVIPLGAGCIRVGNFFNSEILGRPSELPWAIIFKRIDMIPRHPAMLYEAAAYFALLAILCFRYFKLAPKIRPGSQIGILMIWIFGWRFILEFFKENQVGFEQGMILNMGQILSIPFVIAGILLFTGTYRNFLPSGYGHLEAQADGRESEPSKNKKQKKVIKSKKKKKD